MMVPSGFINCYSILTEIRPLSIEFTLPDIKIKLYLFSSSSSLSWNSWFNLFTESSCGRRSKGSLCGLFYKETNPMHEGSSLLTWSSPKGLTSKHHHGEIRFSLTHEFGGNINIQSIAFHPCPPPKFMSVSPLGLL